MSAPVRHTCPDIDKAIAAIRDARKILSDIHKSKDHDEAMQWAGYADDELYRLDDLLEDLRSSNDALRNWGHDCEEKIKELEKELSNIAN